MRVLSHEDNDRIRRELGFDLIEAERKAAAGQPQPEPVKVVRRNSA